MGPAAVGHESIIKIAEGHPTLTTAGHLNLEHAAAASGIDSTLLLRRAADGQLALFARNGGVVGHLVAIRDLELDDPETGRREIPNPDRMPDKATKHLSTAPLLVPRDAVPGVVDDLLERPEGAVSLVAFACDDPAKLFIPEAPIQLSRKNLEVSALEVEGLRRTIAASILPEHLAAAKAAQSTAMQVVPSRAGKYAEKPLSEALRAYTVNKLAHAIASENEVRRVSAGCRLLIDLGGDVAVGEVDADWLRRFRDDHLSKVPANENKIRLTHKTATVLQSIEAVAGTDWPVMSANERDKRMDWIRKWFRWLQGQGWIVDDPGRALVGESVLTAAATRASRKRDDQNRSAFEADHMRAMFSTRIARTGKSDVERSGTRKEPPVEYWLPLLGAYTGARIGELCQLHLDDIRQTPDGTWCIDFNERTPDKRLKSPKGKNRGKASPSLRIVPVHPELIRLGLPEWHAALKAEGYRRFFPELIYSGWDKGYSKDSVKWFSKLMAELGYERDGTLTFHSFRHTFVNALPSDTPERLGNQLTGHERGLSVRAKTYSKDQGPEAALAYVSRLSYELPEIAVFDVAEGLKALKDALGRKQGVRKGREDMGPPAA